MTRRGTQDKHLHLLRKLKIQAVQLSIKKKYIYKQHFVILLIEFVPCSDGFLQNSVNLGNLKCCRYELHLFLSKAHKIYFSLADKILILKNIMMKFVSEKLFWSLNHTFIGKKSKVAFGQYKIIVRQFEYKNKLKCFQMALKIKGKSNLLKKQFAVWNFQQYTCSL